MTRSALDLPADPLFVGLTRPPMRFGVTYTALLVNGVATMEIFLLTKNLLTLGFALPVHGVCVLLCARDARYFDLARLWLQARLPSMLGSARYWGASSAGALPASRPSVHGRRTRLPEVRV